MALAAERRIDLFIGIDVWGRNFYGGGHFNTQQVNGIRIESEIESVYIVKIKNFQLFI